MSHRTFDNLYDIVKKLREPEGCPWDREQTLTSLRDALIEETYECVDAIDRSDDPNTAEELGDIYLVATMMSRIAEEEERFTLNDVLERISQKLIRRHPHVFGPSASASRKSVTTSDDVVRQWEQIKEDENDTDSSAATDPAVPEKDSGADGAANPFTAIPGAFPPLRKAYVYQKKAAKFGFDWPDISGIWEKLNEEIGELKDALRRETSPRERSSDGEPTQGDSREISDLQKKAVEEEIGDLLFTVVNLSRALHIKPDVALNRTNTKFQRRFLNMKKKMHESGLPMNEDTLLEMEKIWQESKE